MYKIKLDMAPKDRVLRQINNFLFNENGQTSTEYILVLTISVSIFMILRLAISKFVAGPGGFTDKLAGLLVNTFFPQEKDLHSHPIKLNF